MWPSFLGVHIDMLTSTFLLSSYLAPFHVITKDFINNDLKGKIIFILFSPVYIQFQTFQCYSHHTGFWPYKALLKSHLNINITGIKVFGPFGSGGRARQMIVQVVFLISP